MTTTISDKKEFIKKVTDTFLNVYGIHPLYSVGHAPFLDRIIETTDADEEAVVDYIFNTLPHSYGYETAQIAARRILVFATQNAN